jgi:hypothetical protein
MIGLKVDLTAWVSDVVIQFFGSSECGEAAVLVKHIVSLVTQCTPPLQVHSIQI